MDTKLKSKFAVIALILMFSFGLNGIVAALFHGDQREYFKRSYFDTDQFQSDERRFVDYLAMFELHPIVPEEAKKAITVTDAEIQEYRNRYGNLQMQLNDIKQQYDSRIQIANSQSNRQLTDSLIAERDKKLEDITKNHTSDDYVRPKIVKEKEQQIDNEVRQTEKLRPDYLELKASFTYNIKNMATGNEYTNLDTTKGQSADQQLHSDNVLDVRNLPKSLHNVPVTVPHYSFGSVQTAAVSAVSAVSDAKIDGPYEGRIAVLKSAPPTSPVMTSYHDFQQKQIVVVVYTIIAVGVFALSLYVIRRAGLLQSTALEKWARYTNRIPLDLLAAGCMFVALIMFGYLMSNHLNYDGSLWNFTQAVFDNLLICALLTTVTYITGRFVLLRVQDIPNRQGDWHRTVIYRTAQGVEALFMNRSLAVQFFLLFMIAFFWGGGTLLTVHTPQLTAPYIMAVLFVGVPTVIVLIRRIGYFNQILKYATELATGNYQADLPVAGKSVLAQLAHSLNTLKSGVKISQNEQAKSERMKTELITNVSHDLRTPLTSVITYTELLKNPDLSTEDRDAYIQIIDHKSKRLKVLIDDLFEASKMASGNIELMHQKADLVQLLQQTLAEHNEQINQSTLHFRVKTPDEPVYAIVDGQRLWRVFDNIIGNILKYALENTRVHIAVETVRDRAIITFKNVTKYELSENVDELFERFKRGDTSRHTDGSGLGLAIAKSIVDLHNGDMDIEVDGDLFKVTVSLQRLP